MGEQLFHRIYEQVPIGLYVSAHDGRLLDANPALLQMLGFADLDAFSEATADQLYANPDERKKWLAEMEANDVVRDYEIQMRRTDGTIIWVKDNASAVRDTDGSLVYYEGSLEDITDRKQADARIRDSEERFRKLFELSPDAIVLLDPHAPDVSWPIVDCNEVACTANGYTRDELIGQSIDIFHPGVADTSERSDYLTRLRAEGSFKGETLHRRKDGTVFPVMYSTAIVRLGERELVLGIDRDITDIKRSQEQLQEQRRSLHLIISSMPNLLVKVDENNQLSAFASPPHFAQFLKSSAEPVGQPIGDLLPAGAADRIVAALASARDTGQPTVIEYEAEEGGDPVYFEVKVTPVSGTREVLVVADNITERKLAELAEHDQRVLAEALRDIAMALNSTLDLKEVLDRILTNLEQVVPYDAANIMLIDEEVVRIVGSRGYSERQLDEAALARRYPIAEMSTLRGMVGSGQPVMIGDTAANPGWANVSETSWVRSYAGAPIRSQDSIIGFINLDSIITGFFTPDHLVRLEAFAAQAAIAIQNAQLYQLLKTQTSELEQANRELEAFSHTVAHDLKSPLQVVIGYASVLQSLYNDQVDEEGQGLLEAMKVASFRMSGMIESLLLLARLRHGEEQLVPVDMVPVAQAAAERFKDMIASRGVEVKVEPEMPQAMGYGPWLEEVFANLISNAIKYIGKDNPAPRIIVRGARAGSVIRYEVADNGLGITAEDQARLFEMFSRFHTGEASGLGLGMSIVQRIVARLGGQLGVESVPGEGSTFWFALAAVE